MKRVVIKAKFFERFVSEAGNDDVGIFKHFHDKSHAFFVFQIDGKPVFIRGS